MPNTTYVIRKRKAGIIQYLLLGGVWSPDLFQGKTTIRPDAITYKSQVLALAVADRNGASILGLES